jgi:hypothetical protein
LLHGIQLALHYGVNKLNNTVCMIRSEHYSYNYLEEFYP